MHKSTKYMMLLSTASSIALGASTAHAQIEEIVVTAQKREQSLNDVPVAVTAFTGEDMKQLGQTQPIDLAGQTPGLSIGNALGSSNPAITVRGVGINDFNTNTNPGVAVYVDEIYQPIPASLSFGLFDMERVEVLKGPQGTLYGRNATGGAVSFVTRKPTDELDGHVSADVGNFGYTSIEAAFSGPLTERISGRLSGLRMNQSEGFQTVKDPAGGSDQGDHGKVDRSAVRGQLDFNLSDNVDLLLAYTYGVDTSDSPLPSMLDDGLAGAQYGTYGYAYTYWAGPTCHNCVLMSDPSDPPQVDMESRAWNATLNWDLGFATLTSVTGGIDMDHLVENDFAGTELAAQNIAYGGNVKQISEEIRLTSNESEFVDWIVGLYYSKTEQDNRSDIDLTHSGFGVFSYWYGFSYYNDPIGAATVYDQSQESLGVFVHTEAHVNDQIRLTGAVRFSQDTLDYDAQVLDTSPDTVFSDQPLADLLNAFFLDGPRVNNVIAENSDHDNKENSITWKVGADYFIKEDTMIYASASSGFKNQGFYGGLGPFSSQYLPYKPESNLSFEAGFKSTMADGRLQLNGAAYKYILEDPQAIVSENIGLRNDVMWNFGEAEGVGAELDMTWVPNENWTIKFGTSWLNSEVTDETVEGKDIFPGAELINGAPMAYAPEWTYNGVIRYDTPMKSNNFFAQIDFDHRGDAQSFAGRMDTLMESRTLLNARMGVAEQDGQWELALWAKNLAETEWSGYSYQMLGSVEMHQAPRTFGVSFTFNIQ